MAGSPREREPATLEASRPLAKRHPGAIGDWTGTRPRPEGPRRDGRGSIQRPSRYSTSSRPGLCFERLDSLARADSAPTRGISATARSNSAEYPASPIARPRAASTEEPTIASPRRDIRRLSGRFSSRSWIESSRVRALSLDAPDARVRIREQPRPQGGEQSIRAWQGARQVDAATDRRSCPEKSTAPRTRRARSSAPRPGHRSPPDKPGLARQPSRSDPARCPEATRPRLREERGDHVIRVLVDHLKKAVEMTKNRPSQHARRSPARSRPAPSGGGYARQGAQSPSVRPSKALEAQRGPFFHVGPVNVGRVIFLRRPPPSLEAATPPTRPTRAPPRRSLPPSPRPNSASEGHRPARRRHSCRDLGRIRFRQ